MSISPATISAPIAAAPAVADTSLAAAQLPALAGEAAIGQAVGVSLQLAGGLAMLALIVWGLRKSFQLSFGGK
jgi:hypothetical protein